MRQETIISHLANAFDSVPPIRQPTITSGPAEISSVSPPHELQQAFNIYENLYT